MSIQSEITRISGNVSDALTAIGAKGVTVPSGSNSDDLADLIAQISGGGDSGYTLTTIVPQQTITPASSDGTYKADLSYLVNLEEGADYIVTINGAEYWTTCVLMWGANYLLGDINHFWSSDEQPYPFGIINENNAMTIATSSGSARTVKVEKIELTGSGGGGGSSTLITKTITANGTYNASDDSADGYSSVTVNVPTPAGASMNTQVAQGTTRRNNTTLGSITSLTCEVAGTYDVYWSCARSNTSQTWGSQLYINGAAYGSENTTWSNHVQNNHLTGVTIPANATVAVYGRSRSGYYIYVPQLTIRQTA